MFFPSDPATEILAHFVGYFEMAVEDMRMRQDFEQIEAELFDTFVDPALVQIAADFAQNYALDAYQPGFDYLPPTWPIRGDAPFEIPSWMLSVPDGLAPAAPQLPAGPDVPALDGPPAPLIGPEPGSVIAVFVQSVILSDNDIVVMGQYDGPITFVSGADTGLTGLQAAAQAIYGPVADAALINSQTDVPLVIEQINAFVGNSGSSAPVSFEAVETLEGTYVNGLATDEAPSLADALPAHWSDVLEDEAEETGDADAATTVHTSYTGEDHGGSVELNAGGNLLVNEAAIFNAGLSSATFAVAGDLHQLNLIVQTNSYIDEDSVDHTAPGMADNALCTTTAVNSASFIQEVLDASGDAAAANPGVMPLNWQVSVVTGDMVFIEWMSQFTFMSDQDISVLCSTGNETIITSGENVGLNSVSFANIGLYYDLILVGGNLYDVNIIVQNNILYDNDTVELLGNSGTAGDGLLSTSGNLLWNQASIHNVGPTEFGDTLPAHYSETMARLDAGNYAMPAGFGQDELFEGQSMLKVLYVSGNIYDMRYVSQTNVLGDADYVAIQKAALLDGQAATEWDVSTGSNALVNVASIKDYDGMGDTAHVGGHVYSDSILIQADILAADDDDALVSEVVAFLDSDDSAMDVADIGPLSTPSDGLPADIIQSMLA
ncbi:MAG TPA: hypothetical protein VGN60_12990 [Devosia sp.]|nr:hypothetical protein [Devosia sp.]